MSNDQKLDSATTILLLKELAVSTLSLVRSGDQNYQQYRGPMGLNLNALTSLPDSEIAKLTSGQAQLGLAQQNTDALQGLIKDPDFNPNDLATAVKDLLKETADLDGAAVIQPKVQALLDNLEARDASTPIDHQKLFESTMTSLLEAGGMFGVTDAVDDLFSNKKGQAAALDQMHEDEFLASSMIVGMVAMDIAKKNGVDVEAGLRRAEETARTNLGIEKPEPQIQPAAGPAVVNAALETKAPEVEAPALSNENPDSIFILASRGQRITPAGNMTEVDIEKFQPPASTAIGGYQLEKHTDNQDWQALERFEESSGSLKNITDVGEAIDALKELGQQKYGPDHRYIEYTNEQGKNVHTSLTPRLEADLRSGKIQDAVLTTYQQDASRLDYEMGELSVTISGGEVVNIGDGMEDRIPQGVLDFAVAEAREQGIALTVQAQRIGSHYWGNPEYRLLDDEGNEVAIGIKWRPDTGEVYVINDPDVPELTGPSNGLSDGSTVINKADGPDITNRIEVEGRPEPQMQWWDMDSMKPENVSELAHMIETGVVGFHAELLENQSELDTIDNEAALNVAYSKFLEKLHDVQATGNPEGLSQAFKEFQEEYGAELKPESEPNVWASYISAEGLKGFQGLGREIQEQTNAFYIRNDIEPVNIASPERQAYELNEALERQTAARTTYEGVEHVAIVDRRDLVETYKAQYETSTNDPIRFQPDVDGYKIDFPQIYSPNMRDIQGWPPERIGELTDKQLQDMDESTLAHMSAAIDPDYQKFETARDAAIASDHEASTPEKTLQHGAPGLGN